MKGLSASSSGTEATKAPQNQLLEIRLSEGAYKENMVNHLVHTMHCITRGMPKGVKVDNLIRRKKRRRGEHVDLGRRRVSSD